MRKYVLCAAALTLAGLPPAAAAAAEPAGAGAAPVAATALQSVRNAERAVRRQADRRRIHRPVRPVRRPPPTRPRYNQARIRNALAEGATPARLRKKVARHLGQ